MKHSNRQESRLAFYSKLVLKVMLILGPIWGYIAMFVCKITHGGDMMDTLTFYMMVAGWIVSPIGILLLFYGIVTKSIIEQRKERAGE
jgi:hypothetical protein